MTTRARQGLRDKGEAEAVLRKVEADRAIFEGNPVERRGLELRLAERDDRMQLGRAALLD